MLLAEKEEEVNACQQKIELLRKELEKAKKPL